MQYDQNMQMRNFTEKIIPAKRNKEIINSSDQSLSDSLRILKSSQLTALHSLALLLLTEVEQMRRLETDLKEEIRNGEGISLYDELQRIETAIIRSALIRTGGSQVQAAKLLRIKITTLNEKVKRYQIKWTGFDPV